MTDPRKHIWTTTAMHVLVLVSLFGLIAAATWPWMAHPASHLPDHFDPPFHAWKLRFMTETIMRGNCLPPHGNTNVFYPASMSLYFDALLLPQALVAAPLSLLTSNPVLLYNIVHFIFWGLSGYCLFLLLRSAGLQHLAAWLGGALFCLLPYRIGYIVEFNMQQCFGIPLFYLCLLKFFRRPGVLWGTALATALILQATSELYQAIFLVFTAPLVALPLVWGQIRSLLVSRRFWVGALTFCLVGACAGGFFLQGYYILSGAAGFSRNRMDMVRHSVEPLAYLTDDRVWSGIAGLPARVDETPVFPTFTILILAMAHAILARRLLHRQDAEGSVSVWEMVARWTRVVAASAALLVPVIILGFGLSKSAEELSTVLNASFLTVLFTTAYLCTRTRGSQGARLLSGLSLAAAFSFIMSLGPMLGVRECEWYHANWTFGTVARHIPIMGGMRVMSRFSVIALLFLCCAAAFGFRRLFGKMRYRFGFAVAVVGLVMLESHPHDSNFVTPLTRPALAEECGLSDVKVLAVLPMGWRWQDSEYMLALAARDRLLVNGWGGFLPAFQWRVGRAFGDRQIEKGVRILEELYPPATVAIDTEWLEETWGNAQGMMESLTNAGCTRKGGNSRFVLFDLPHHAPAARDHVRRVRNDLLRESPHLLMTVTAEQPAMADVFVNHTPLASFPVDTSATPAVIAIPESLISDRYDNHIQVSGRGGISISLEQFSLKSSADASTPHPARVVRYRSDDDSLGTLPAEATACRIDFGRRIALAGYTLSSPTCRPGDTVAVTYHWLISPRYAFKRALTVYLHARDADGIRFQRDERFLSSVPPVSIEIQPTPKIFDQKVLIKVPPGTPAGPYSLVFGLSDPDSKTHRRASSDLPRDGGGIRWQDTLTVVPAETE